MLRPVLTADGALPDLVVLDAQDREVAFASLHAEAPVALIFLRHFG